MLNGYNEFSSDIQVVFLETIQQFHFREISSDFDSVILQNDVVQLVFTTMEDDIGMSVKIGDDFYRIKDIARIINPVFYGQWEQDAKSATINLPRNDYYKTWLKYMKILSDKYLSDTYASGILPMQENIDVWEKSNNDTQARFGLAWKAVQQLPYDNAIRKKYIADDYSWIDDMIAALDKEK